MAQLSNLPTEAADLKLLKQNLRPASYAGIPFGVVSYAIQSGRDIDVTTLYEGASTTLAGAGNVRANLAKRAGGGGTDTATVRGSRALALAELNKLEGSSGSNAQNLQQLKTFNQVTGFWEEAASSNLLDPGEHPLVDDKGALPMKITLRAFFIDERFPEAIARTEEGVVSGSGRGSYIINRDRFLEKVNNPNPNMLQLPTYGVFPAVAGTVTTSYDNDKAGIEYVDVEFYRATSDLVAPTTTGNKLLITERSAELENTTKIQVAALQEKALLDSENNTGTLPTDVADRMKLSVEDRLALIQGGSDSLASSIIDSINDKVATIDKYNRELVSISNKISTLILVPAELSDQILNTYKTLTGAITDPVESFNYMRNKLDIFVIQMKDVTYNALDTLGLYDSSTYVENMSHCFSSMAEASSNTVYDSVEAILEAREQITITYEGAIDVVARFPQFDDVLTSFQDIYGNLIGYLIDQQANLPNARKIKVREHTPLVVTAYHVYGDSNQEADLAIRNNVTSSFNPPPELEVLAL